MRNLEVKILDNGYGLPIPKYETEGAAGLDLFAATKEDTKIIVGSTLNAKTSGFHS